MHIIMYMDVTVNRAKHTIHNTNCWIWILYIVQGVFDGACGIKLNHGVTAVGYGSTDGLDWILVKNSWGANWGEKGYIKMKRNTGIPQGLCGINIMPSYPLKEKLNLSTL